MPLSLSLKKIWPSALPNQLEQRGRIPFLLVITASVRQLNVGPGGNNARRPTAEGNAFQNLGMVATLAAPTRAVCYEGTTIKELDE